MPCFFYNSGRFWTFPLSRKWILSKNHRKFLLQAYNVATPMENRCWMQSTLKKNSWLLWTWNGLSLSQVCTECWTRARTGCSFICLVWQLNASSPHHSLFTWWPCLECHQCQIAWPMSLKDQNVLMVAFYCKEIPCLMYPILTIMDIHIDSCMIRDLLLIHEAQTLIVFLNRHISSTSIHSTLWLVTLPLYFFSLHFNLCVLSMIVYL